MPGDVLFLLDRVAEGDPVHRDAGRLDHLDLATARGVELGPRRGQTSQHLCGRVGLHGVEDVGRGQQLTHAPEIVLDHVEVDHQARRLGLLLAEVTENTLGHRWGVPRRIVSLSERDRTTTYGARRGAIRQPILD